MRAYCCCTAFCNVVACALLTLLKISHTHYPYAPPNQNLHQTKQQKRFVATVTGVECCVTLPDGRERTVRCATGHANDDNVGGGGGDGDGGDDNDNAFVGYGRSKRAAQQAAAEAARAWFQKEGLWDPNAPKPPLPETGGLVRVFGARWRWLQACLVDFFSMHKTVYIYRPLTFIHMCPTANN